MIYKNNYNANKVGDRIKKLRRANHMTQEELATRLMLSVDSISNIENGKTTCMPEHMIHICELFDVSMDYFYFDDMGIKQTGRANKNRINDLLDTLGDDDIDRIEQMIRIFLRQ